MKHKIWDIMKFKFNIMTRCKACKKSQVQRFVLQLFQKSCVFLILMTLSIIMSQMTSSFTLIFRQHNSSRHIIVIMAKFEVNRFSSSNVIQERSVISP